MPVLLEACSCFSLQFGHLASFKRSHEAWITIRSPRPSCEMVLYLLQQVSPILSNSSALQQMPDRILQGWFKAVSQAAATPPPHVTPHTLTKDAKSYIKKLHQLTQRNDKKDIIDKAVAKGYQFIGQTVKVEQLYAMASKNLYCSFSNVRMVFDKENPSKEPYTVSFNRKIGSVGPSRCKPTAKHLHYEENLDVVCRALNLAQRNFKSAEIQAWVNWIVQCWSTTEVFARDNPDFEIGEEDDDDEDDEEDEFVEE